MLQLTNRNDQHSGPADQEISLKAQQGTDYNQQAVECYQVSWGKFLVYPIDDRTDIKRDHASLTICKWVQLNGFWRGYSHVDEVIFNLFDSAFIGKSHQVTQNQLKMFEIIPKIFYNQYKAVFGHSF